MKFSDDTIKAAQGEIDCVVDTDCWQAKAAFSCVTLKDLCIYHGNCAGVAQSEKLKSAAKFAANNLKIKRC